MAERRKNWFQRQIHRMGSMRSSSTTYSSGGLFNRTRHNSVYSSPENGLPNSTGINGHHINGLNGSTPHLQKITLYDRLWGRKSMKSRRGSTQGNILSPIWDKIRIGEARGSSWSLSVFDSTWKSIFFMSNSKIDHCF